MEVLPWCSWNYLEGTASLNPSRARLPSWGRLLSNAAQPIIYMPGVCLFLLFLIRCPELRQDSINMPAPGQRKTSIASKTTIAGFSRIAQANDRNILETYMHHERCRD